MPNCVVCSTPNASRQPGAGDFALFDCPRCGSCALSGTAESALERMLAEMPLPRSLMSHTLRRMQRPDKKAPSHQTKLTKYLLFGGSSDCRHRLYKLII